MSVLFRVRQSARARRLQLYVQYDTVCIVAPLRAKRAEILAFFRARRLWVKKQLTRKQADPYYHLLAWPKVWLTGATLPYRGNRIALQLEYGQKTSVLLTASTLVATLPAYDEGKVKRVVWQWYLAQALFFAQEAINTFCPKLQRWPQRVSIRQQRTRWGSCTSRGTLSINGTLLLAPEGILEYVVVHELAHLWYRGHHHRFWCKVAKGMPHFQEYDRWLTQHGECLKPCESEHADRRARVNRKNHV